MKTKRFLSIVLTLAMLVGMFPGMSLTAYAEGNTTEISPSSPSGTMTITLTIAPATVDVTDVTLDKTATQTIDVGGSVAFTATVAPDNATDKKVKWSVGGTNPDAVKLYSDADCTAGNEVGTDATETLTVYAKGISAGSATITATSNADSTKTASCAVTVNAAQTQTETLLTTITATGKEQASYNPENVATVSFSYSSGGSSAYLANWGWWGYGWAATVNAAEGYTITKCVFYDDANRTATDSEAPFVVETTEEDKTPKVNGTPILAYTSKGIKKIEVYGYVTLAASYSVTYNTNGGTINSGNITEYTEGTGATLPTDVTKEGYVFGGWYDNESLTGSSVSEISETDTGDKEYWAMWVESLVGKTYPVDGTGNLVIERATRFADGQGGTAIVLSGTYAISFDNLTDSSCLYKLSGNKIYITNDTTKRIKALTIVEGTGLSGNPYVFAFLYDNPISNTVIFSVVNGLWDDGTTADKTVTLTGYEGDTLRLAAAQIPAVGTKPSDTYKAGSWDVTPSADTAITADTTYTYTYTKKAASTAKAATVSAWTSNAVMITCEDDNNGTVTGQEYVLVEKGEDPDWTKAQELNGEGFIKFENLTPATEYTVYARVKETEDIAVSESVATNVVTSLNGFETQGEAKTGETITIIPDPEDAKGLTWQWYYAEENEDGDVVKGDAIEGATSSSYEVKDNEVGKYLWFVISKGGEELESGCYGPIRISIDITVTLEGWAYGEDPNTPVVTGNTGNGNVTFTYAKKGSEDPESETVPTLPGEYKVFAYVEESGDYAFGSAEADFTITKGTPVVTAPTAKSLTYTGSAQELVTAGTATGGTMQYALGSDATTAPAESWSTSIPTATNAGTYYVWYKAVGDKNHNDSTAKCITVKVAKAAITITADDKSSQYKADLVELTWKIGGDYVVDDKLGITAFTTANNTANVGEYPITLSWNENPNYKATLVNGKYFITKTGLPVTATAYTGKYDGKAHGITVDVGESDAVVYYSTEKELTAENYKMAGNTTAPTRTDAGKTNVYYYVESANYTPDTVYGSKDIEIAKADALADADLKEGERATANTLTYNEKAQALVTAPAGVPTGYTEVQYSLDGTTWTDTIPTGTAAGSYIVHVKYLADANHTDFEATSVNVVIGKAAVGNKTVTETVEVSSAGVKDKTIDLKDYLVAGAALAQKEAADGTPAGAKVETAGALAGLITPGTMKAGVFTYSVAENDGGLTGQMILTISSLNYADYTITINLASAKKVTEVVVESEGVTETAVETVEVPALEDYTEAQPEATVEVKMEVKLESEAKVTEKIGTTTLNKIEESVNKAFGGVNSSELKKEYLDVTVTKSVNGGEAQEIADVNRVLEISVGYDLTGKYNPIVVREHGGTVSQFTRLSGKPAAGSFKDGTFYVEGSGTTGKIYIYARYFSTYTVAYTTAASYQVTFDDALGNTEQVVVATGNKATKPANPKRSGYDFDGWYVDGTNTKWNFDTAVTSDLVLKAKWSEQDDDDDEKDGEVVVTPVATTAQPRSPKTNDGLPGYGFWMLLLAAGIAVSAGSVFGRKKNGLEKQK